MGTNLAALFGTQPAVLPRIGSGDAPKLTRAQLAALAASAPPPVLPQVGGAPVALQSRAAATPSALAAPPAAVLPKVGEPSAAGAPSLGRAEMSSLAGNVAPLLPPLGNARVANPLEDQMEREQSLVNKDLTPRTPFHELSGMGKVGRVLGTIGQAAGTMFAPMAMAVTPGTALHQAMQTRHDMKELQNLSALEDRAQQEGRANDEMGLRMAAVQGRAAPKSPWAMQPGEFNLHGEPVGLERNTETGEYRVAAYPEGVTRETKPPKEATDAFDQWMRDPQDYERFMGAMAKIKGGDKGLKGAYGGFGPAFLAYRMLDMAYNDNPKLLPVLSPLIARMLAQPGETPEQTNALQSTIGALPTGQPENAGGEAIGLRMPESPTGATRSRGQFAQSILPDMGEVEQQIKALGPDLGPYQGRWNEFYQGKLGADAPQYAGLRSSLHNIATAWMRLHGNSEKTMNDFLQTLRTAQTPDDLLAALGSIESQAEHYVGEGAGRPGQKMGGAPWAPPQGAPNAPKTDGQFLYADGVPVAKSEGGKWVQP